MAPVPVYTNSPITAAKPDGVAPKTASAADPSCQAGKAPPLPTSGYTPVTYAAARQGATPSLPGPTGSAAAQPYSHLQPTPTTSMGNASPAPPQPGSVPVSSLPPPPKAGEKHQPSIQTHAPPTTTMPVPHQMAIPTPVAPHPSQQRGTSTTPMASSLPYGTQLPSGPTASSGDGTQSLSHPPGYQQNVNASELGRYQRSVGMEEHQLDGSESSIWGAAKKLAQQTGERLAAAENEVWKKINKE
ncbi:hypothetical protein SAMD00023353_3700990 [Rosellinia necatrix]|uniref:Uncharacterized protein n=1 Tax=Rosellinia necatrix TaxID=77044 RepID=A0A1W2TM14_ROSNE|nr:hypothetical protein SAMD00023353_3700990 [Rosellinia necatrix]